MYQLTQAFPGSERFGLTNQLRRAVVSVSSNIAEGHSRQGREYLNFLSIARGSLAEAESQLYLAQKLGFLAEDKVATAFALMDEISRMLSALRRRLSAFPRPSPLTPHP